MEPSEAWQLYVAVDLGEAEGSILCHHRHRRQRLRQRKAAGLLFGRDALNMELVKERYGVVEG